MQMSECMGELRVQICPTATHARTAPARSLTGALIRVCGHGALRALPQVAAAPAEAAVGRPPGDNEVHADMLRLAYLAAPLRPAAARAPCEAVAWRICHTHVQDKLAPL
jgi:hypothetical protein